MPEAYLLLHAVDGTRPGLVVLDADGRRAAGISLLDAVTGKMEPSEVEAFLGEAAKAGVHERFTVEGKEASIAKLKKRLEGRKGVRKAEVVKDGALVLAIETGALSPATLEQDFAEVDEALRLADPVECEPRPTHTEAARIDLTRVAGLWYRDMRSASRAWLPRMLLHPAAWKDSGLTTNLVEKRYTFHSLPKGPRACVLADTVGKVPGVLAVFPDVFDDAMIVVGSDRTFDPAKAAAAFTEAGHEPDDDETDDE